MKKRVLSAVCAVVFCAVAMTGCKGSDYKEAIALMDSGNYEEAASAFEALGDYKDSKDMAKDCAWKAAIDYFGDSKNCREQRISGVRSNIMLTNEKDGLFIGVNAHTDDTLLVLGGTLYPDKRDTELEAMLSFGSNTEYRCKAKLDFDNYKEGDQLSWGWVTPVDGRIKKYSEELFDIYSKDWCIMARKHFSSPGISYVKEYLDIPFLMEE